MSGDELHELSERQDPRLLRALDVVAPGGALREGLDNIVHSRTGGLIVVGDAGDISHLLSGGIKLDIDYTPAMLYQVAKMDGAIITNQNATKLAWVNVQLTPDPTILSLERIVGSGISCTLAQEIFVASGLRTMAPSIFATW